MKIKRKLLIAGIALALVISGASMASASVDGTKAQETNINVTQAEKFEEIEPMFFSWAAQRVGRELGKFAADYFLGKNDSANNIHNYKNIIESFDY